MKAILIEQLCDGWIVRGQDDCSLNSYNPVDIRVYQSLKQLQADLPNLLQPESHAPCPTPGEIAQAREKAIGSAGSGLL